MRERTNVPFELVIVETETQHLINEADVYVYEKTKDKANTSINRGFKVASGDYIVYFSNDVYVGESWLESMLECFNKEDCGLSTCGAEQLGYKQSNEIIERIYFPIAMIPKEDAWYDTYYNGFWDDTDLIMRVYSKGKRMYMNLNSICVHLDRQTEVPCSSVLERYEDNRRYFINKWKEFDSPTYRALAGI